MNGILVFTPIPLRANSTLELGDITVQSECALQALKVELERALSTGHVHSAHDESLNEVTADEADSVPFLLRSANTAACASW